MKKCHMVEGETSRPVELPGRSVIHIADPQVQVEMKPPA
jgi:hypothetical protein